MLADTHALWGEGSLLATRQRVFHEFCRHLGPDYLDMTGLIASTGEVQVSLKRYAFRFGPSRAGALRLLGIGAVFTQPKFRRQGLAAQLLNTVLADAKQRGFDAAILYSDIEPAYYEALGFRRLPAVTAWMQADALFPEAEPLEVRVTKSEDIPELLDWWERSWPLTSRWRIHRNLQHWELLRVLNTPPQDYWLIDRYGRTCGYLAINAMYQEVRVGEWAVVETEFQQLLPRVWATVRHLAPAGARVSAWLRPEEVPFLPAECVPRLAEIPMIADLSGQIDWRAANIAYLGTFDHI